MILPPQTKASILDSGILVYFLMIPPPEKQKQVY
jgi:hypothetical protein